jgi:hypothetical protein
MPPWYVQFIRGEPDNRHGANIATVTAFEDFLDVHFFNHELLPMHLVDVETSARQAARWSCPSLLENLGFESKGLIPYRGFVPDNQRFVDPLFCWLLPSAKQVPIRVKDAGWIIEPSLVTEWGRLERLLLHLREGLLCFPLLSVNLMHTHVPPPTHYVQLSQDTVRKIRKSASKCRSAFLLLLAEVSFLMAKVGAVKPVHQRLPDPHLLALGIHWEGPHRDEGSLPLWFRWLKRLGWEEKLLEIIACSPIADPGTPRKGLIVDARESNYMYAWGEDLQAYFTAQVPVYIRFTGPFPDIPEDSVLASISLNDSDIERARARTREYLNNHPGAVLKVILMSDNSSTCFNSGRASVNKRVREASEIVEGSRKKRRAEWTGLTPSADSVKGAGNGYGFGEFDGEYIWTHFKVTHIPHSGTLYGGNLGRLLAAESGGRKGDGKE